MTKLVLIIILTFVVTAAKAEVIRGSEFIYDNDAPQCLGRFIYDSAMPVVKCGTMRFETKDNHRVAA